MFDIVNRYANDIGIYPIEGHHSLSKSDYCGVKARLTTGRDYDTSLRRSLSLRAVRATDARSQIRGTARRDIRSLAAGVRRSYNYLM